MILALLASPAWAEDVGQLIFQGAAGGPVAVVEGQRLRACHGCHGRDGQGGDEGAAPAIGPGALRQALLLRQRPDGTPLSPLMPQYALSDDALAALTDYMTRLPTEQRLGITPRQIHFAVPFAPGTEARAQDYATALREALGLRGAYGRQPVVTTVEITPGTCPSSLDAAAVLGMGPELDDLRPCLAENTVPLLYPIYPLADLPGDPGSVRTLLPGWTEIAADLATQLVDAGITDLVIPPGDHPLLLALADEAAVRPDLRLITDAPPDPANTMSLRIGWDGEAVPGLPTILLPDGPAPADLPGDGYLLVYGADLVTASAEAGIPLLDLYAREAAARVATALSTAGRGVTRATLLRAAEPGDAQAPGTVLLPLRALRPPD